MDGYQYASFINSTCQELHKVIKVTPVTGYVYSEKAIGNKWRDVLCHPEDKGQTDELLFKHPFRDI